MKKNIFAILFVFLLVPMMAQAVQYAGYEDVVPVNNYSYSTATGISATDAVTNELDRVNRQLAQAKKERAEITKKQDVTNRSLAGALHLGAETFKDVREVKKDVKSNAEAIKVVDGALNSMGRQSFIETVVQIVVGLIVGGVIIFLIQRARRDVTAAVEPITTSLKENTCAVDGLTARVMAVETQLTDMPERVAKAVRKVEPTTLNIKDVDGKNVMYVPPITADGERFVTLYVPESVTRPVTNPAQIIRAECGGNIGKLIDSVRRSVKEYLALKANPPVTPTERQKQIVALFDHLDSTGELKIS